MNAIRQLGLNITLNDWDKANDIPLFVSNNFDIKRACINGIDCLCLIPYDSLPNVDALKKQIKYIQNVDNLPVFLQLDNISTFRRDNLIENDIAFILKDQMVFLPFMATLLTNKKGDNVEAFDKLTTTAQLLFIWILYQDSDKYYISEALEPLNTTNMSLTRAYRQLAATGLFNEHKGGRKIYLTSDLNKIDLYMAMKPYLKSPVIKEKYIFTKDLNCQMYKAGDSLLSDLTFISQPRLPVYAVYKNNMKDVATQDELIQYGLQVKVQIWDYNPLIFSKDNKTIDNISLITSYLDDDNERIEKEIEGLLERTLNFKEKDNDRTRII